MPDRRWVLMTGLAGLAVISGGPSAAQGDVAGDVAQRFIRDLLATAQSGNEAAVTEFLRSRVDTAYGFQVAFADVPSITPGQRQRLSELLLRFIAREAVLVADIARNGQMRVVTARPVEAGTLVEGMFRDSAGEYPFNVLVANDPATGRFLVRDMGSPRQSSVVSKLAYATQSLQIATPDAEVWITAFEQALGSP
jgi:hypothetical protein